MPDMTFGRLLTAMVTPFAADGSLDVDAAQRLAEYLVDQMANDSLIVNGTTGEAPTTTDVEKAALVGAVRRSVGDRAKVVAGVGTFDTAHTVALARQAADAGADGLLVVTPYYSKPPQDALIDHFVAVADATDLPVIVYDIPKRTATPLEPSTLIALAAHPRIVGVKDAKGDIVSSAQVMTQTDLVYYSGDDAMTLPLLSVGAVGVVGTSTHFTGRRMKQLIEAYVAGRTGEALAIYRELYPVLVGVFAAQGCILVKSGLAHLGLPGGGLRRPLRAATEAEAEAFNSLLDAAAL